MLDKVLIANRGASERAWAFWKRRFTKLRRRMPPMLVTRPIEALPALGTKAWRRDVASFFRANPVPTGARSVKQTLEQFVPANAALEDLLDRAEGIEGWAPRLSTSRSNEPAS